jgi:alpha/beta superfamily hydrolase
MLQSAARHTLVGAAGRIEFVLDWPELARPQGIAYVGHPHPLYGGTLDNKVASTLARTFAALGWLAVRPNFRGVGGSEGTHDEGRGETADFVHLIDTLPAHAAVDGRVDADLPVALAGFSFGSFVAARAARTLAARHQSARHLVLVGCAAGKWPMPEVRHDTLVIHGEHDETIPLADVFEWARPQSLPVVVVPGADHFFHRRLPLLKALISAHILGMSAFDGVSQTP